MLREVFVQDPAAAHRDLRRLDGIRAAHHEEETGSVTERHVRKGLDYIQGALYANSPRLS